MFAVVKTGGKQYRVTEGDVVRVEKLESEAGKQVTLNDVLMVGDDKGVKVGSPLVDGASVTFDVLETKKDDKIVVFKKKRRHNYRRKKGHRQWLTVLKVAEISAAPKKKAAPKKAEAKAETAEAAPKKAAPKKTAASEKAAAPKKAAPKKAAPKKAAPKKAAKPAKDAD